MSRGRLLSALFLCLAVGGVASSAGAGRPVAAAYRGTVVAVNSRDTVVSNRPAVYAGPPLRLEAVAVGALAGEPTIGIDRQGSVYYAAIADAGLNTPPEAGITAVKSLLLASRDGGRKFASAQPKILGSTEHPITFDPYVYVDPVTGRVFVIDMLNGADYLSYSQDGGHSWSTTVVTDFLGMNDHQTLFAGDPPAGNPALKPSDPAFPRVLYYCVNSIPVAGCAASTDGGRTFLPAGTPPFAAGASVAGPAFCSGQHGHGVADAAGRIFLPHADCAKRPMLAVSDDGGLTWADRPVSSGVGTYGLQTSVAVDPAGNLYYVWWDDLHRLPYLAVSRDHGMTFGPARMVAPPGVREVNFPTVDAGDIGRIAISFPGTTWVNDDDARLPSVDPIRPWSTYVVVSTDALAADPLFVAATANPPEDPVHRGQCQARCAGMLDFLDVAVAPTGQGQVFAAAVDTCTGPCRSGDASPADRQAVVVRQVGGPALRGSRTALRPG